MKLHTFRGRSIGEARDAAIAALGEGASVVATRKIPREGILGFLGAEEYEVMASPAVDPPKAQSPVFAAASSTSAPVERQADLNAVRAELQRELRSIKNIISKVTAESANNAVRRDLEAELIDLREDLAAQELKIDASPAVRRLFGAIGVERNVARILAKRLADLTVPITTVEGAARAVSEVLPKTEWPIKEGKRSLISMIGPTGAGKTTTLAKIAARAIEANRTATFVSCDSFRVGATEQLERFAELLGADFKVAVDWSALTRIVAGAKTDFVFIDTAGRGVAEKDGVEASLGQLQLGPQSDKHTLLCVPAAIRDVDIRRTFRQFRASSPTSLVITKIDETASPSGVVHAPIATKLPIIALCFGQRVPEDVSAVDAATLSRVLLNDEPPPQRRERAAA